MKYFITGTPGSGKTTVGKLLEEKGYKFVDVDHEPGFANWFNKETGSVVPPNPNADTLWYSQHDWNWDRKALQNLLDDYKNKKKIIFVSGIASNQTRNLDLFDKIFFLKTSPKELRKRMIQRRSDANDKEVDHVFEWHESFEREMLRHGAIPIDAGQNPDKVVEDILSIME